MSKIKYLGHASLKIITNEQIIIYIDPYVGEYEDEADIILVTHEHMDHNQVNLVPKKNNTIIIRENNLKVGYMYHKTSIHGIEIEAVEAYNYKHDKNTSVGYIIRFDGNTIYVAGDTSITNHMKTLLPNYNIDYAFLPVDGIYNMDAFEACECANIIKPKYAIPYHTNPTELFDIEIANKFKYKNRIILKLNEEIEF